MSYARQTIGGLSSGTAVLDSLKVSGVQLEEVAERLQINKEGIDPEILNGWRERILNLSREIAVVKNLSEKTAEVVEIVAHEKRSADQLSSSSSSSSADLSTENKLKQHIKQKIQEKVSSFDPTKDASVKRIEAILLEKKSAELGDDEDFAMVETAFSKADTICPYTTLTYVEPWKRYQLIQSHLFNIFLQLTHFPLPLFHLHTVLNANTVSIAWHWTW